jgi:hypothetical protein
MSGRPMNENESEYESESIVIENARLSCRTG